MAASLDPSTFGNSADTIFKTLVVRPFLNKPGNLTGKHCFRKPELGPWRSMEAQDQLTVRPFHDFEREATTSCLESRSLQLKVTGRKCSGHGGLGAPSRSTCLGRLRDIGLMGENNRPITAPLVQTMSEQGGLFAAADGVVTIRDVDGRAQTSSSSRADERRRRPALDFSFSDDDPGMMQFPEEPEDPRVRLPAHRIGDSPPESCTALSQTMSKQSRGSPTSLTMRSVHSAPALHVLGARASFSEFHDRLRPQDSAEIQLTTHQAAR
eukprot:TRINITY_DN27314_c1_g1_i1.p1 TRINITY_DN27314_c1_g1~~TRINITY_DN27314_c1_g1_i1.p1  ORF type:complete len:267 (+),score=26.28 TRINITY_DN27314_c1_g1_i1:62-862(+)